MRRSRSTSPGDVDFLVATDAIGMGLNLDVDHVAFAQEHKFDGFSHRRLTPAEMGQIAGRAGRHVRNGTFGVTGQVNPFDDDLVERLETHHFDPVKVLIWRNRDLDFSSIADLKASLEMPSSTRLLMKSFPAPDAVALDHLSRVDEIAGICRTSAMIRLLWDVCQTPDFRKISPGEHAELLRSIFLDLASKNRIDTDWFAAQVKLTDRIDGDIDALSQRIAHVRTWTYISHRQGWMNDPVHWQELTREIEDRLSDALHESLTKRFIDRRTSVLMKRLRENAMLEAEIAAGGEVTVEGHHVGRLQGFRFTPDASATGSDAKAASGAAMKALAAEIVRRAERLAASPNGDIALGSDATLRWLGDPVGKIVSGDDLLKPRIVILADEQLTGPPRDLVANRLDRWLSNHINTLLKPLADLGADEQLTGIARGVAFRLVENLGVIDRRDIASEIQSLDQQMRASLRRHGVRFGAYHIFVPALLKPAPAGLICMLWGMKHDRLDEPGLTGVPHMLASGRTSFPADATIDPAIYRICGYKVLGPKAVRIDILERLADLIRPALSWKPQSGGKAPEGAVDGRAFTVAPSMLSILGATHEDMEAVLKGLGYRAEPRKETDIAAMRERAAALAAPAPLEAPAAPAEATPAEAGTEAAASAEAIAAPDGESVQAADAAAEPATAETPAGQSAEPAPVETAPEAGLEPAGEVQDETAPLALEAVEEKMVLLWRPGRPDRQGQHNRGHDRAGHDRSGQERSGPRQGHNRHDSNRQPAAAPNGEAQSGRPQPGDRSGQRRDGRQDGQRFEKRGGGDRHGKRNEGGNGFKGGKPGDNRRDNNKPFNAPPRQAEKPVDPDSPFAKLLALKAQMEKGNG